MKRMIIVVATAAALSVAGASAQTINERRENQQDRIANGIQQNQLSPGETAKVERQEKAINQQVAGDRYLNGGKLTPGERKQVNGELNRTSAEIYKDRHNAAHPVYGNNKVDQRRENQQDRIAQGVRSGSLNAGQTAKLEGQEAKINQQVRTDRAANGGKLTPGEKKQVNKEQNVASRRIYNNKHK